MPSTPLTPEQRLAAQALAEAIRAATAAESEELAGTLVATADQDLFGQNEFKLRALGQQIAAKALAQHLARKKRPRRGQCDLPPLRPDR